MKTAFCILALAGTALLAGPAALAGGMTPRPDLAQAQRCGPRPMKPSSCLNGAWICRCHTGGQICEWELVGCSPSDSLMPRPDGRHPLPPSPDDPVQPGLHGR
jgi:hypothetical protein